MELDPVERLVEEARKLMAGNGEPFERFVAVAGAIAEATGSDRAWIIRLEGEWLRTAGGVGMVLADPRHQPLHISKGVVGRVVREDSPRRIDDVIKDPDYYAATALTRAEMAVPIRRDGTVVGVINCEANRIKAYGDAEQRMIEAVAAVVAPYL
jgi:putative methionine-R-sulfoxide reductase with GAF domain